MIFCDKFAKKKSFMVVIYLVHVTRLILSILLYEQVGGLLFYSRDLILKDVMCVKF